MVLRYKIYMKRVAINGFGRIGRRVFRKLLVQDQVRIVAINDLGDPFTLAHLLQYDSIYGKFSEDITLTEDELHIGAHTIKVFKQPNPSKMPWRACGVEVVVESTGLFTNYRDASKHLQSGASKVLISAPATGEVPTIVLGVNDHILQSDMTVVSNASCTTNCLAPMVKILDDTFGVDKGFISTVHAYTSDQRLHDAPHKDLRRARAAALSIIPTSTGAAKAVGLVLPHLEGKLDGLAVRVPVPNGSLIDFTVWLTKSASKAAINEAVAEASKKTLKNILQYTTAPIVSQDIVGSSYSCIFDSLLTYTHGNLAKVVGWYDNETGYAQRVVDLLLRL